MALKLKPLGGIQCTEFSECEDPSVGNSPLNYTTWIEGGTDASGFGRNGDVGENEIVLDDGPFGPTLVWLSKPSGNSSADGGWNSSSFPVDETKLYRFTVWVRNVGSANSGTFYHGLHGYPNPVLSNENNVANSNPYFDCPGIAGIPTEWTLSVGHVYPSDSSITAKHPETGRWSMDGTHLSPGGCNISGDAKWAVGTTSANERVYHFYSTDSNAHLQFAFPRVDVVDGTEPSIEQLLNNFEISLGGTITRCGELDETTGATGSAKIQLLKSGTIRVDDEFEEV